MARSLLIQRAVSRPHIALLLTLLWSCGLGGCSLNPRGELPGEEEGSTPAGAAGPPGVPGLDDGRDDSDALFPGDDELSEPPGQLPGDPSAPGPGSGNITDSPADGSPIDEPPVELPTDDATDLDETDEAADGDVVPSDDGGLETFDGGAPLDGGAPSEGSWNDGDAGSADAGDLGADESDAAP